MKWTKKDVLIKTNNDDVSVNAYCCDGIAIHPSYLGNKIFGDGWTITLIKAGLQFREGLNTIEQAKLIAKDLIPLAKWDTMTLGRWNICNNVRQEAFGICYPYDM